MTTRIELKTILSNSSPHPDQQKSAFALMNLGIIDSLENGSMSVDDAVNVFFHADNCLYVHRYLQDADAEQLMSHGVQLSDLFIVLPAQEAQQEFQRELSTMRGLCLALLAEPQLAI